MFCAIISANKMQTRSSSTEVNESGPKMTKNQEAAMDEALRIYLVMENILKNLTFHDLKSCRLVTLVWNNVASSIMSKLDVCQVVLLYDSEEDGFRHYRQLDRRWGRGPCGQILVNQNLAALNKLLENSSNFPCTNFSFHCGSVDHPNIQKLFQLYGQELKTLKFIQFNDSDESNGNSLENLLVNQTPSLEDLTVNGVEYKFKNQPCLPSLKNFSFENCSNCAYEIMKAAPNLQIVNKLNWEQNNTFQLPLIIKAEKTHTVQHFICDLYSSRDLDMLSQFVAARPHLEELTFVKLNHNQTERRRIVITELLQVSKNSLQVLNLSKSFGHLGVTLPRLQNLKILKLGLRQDTTSFQIIFPPLINLNDTFPNLTTLNFRHFRPNFSWEQSFPPTSAFVGNLSMVRKLEISDQCPDLYMERLGQLCPNFKHLVVHSQPTLSCHGEDERVNLEAVLIDVFRIFQHLENLEVRVRGQKYEYFCLDSAFTGMTPGECFRLKSTFKEDDELEEGFRRLKVRPAICDLKELKSLKLSLESSSYYMLDKVSRKELPLTWVSIRYGFALYPLAVTMLYDQGCLECEGSEGLKSQLDCIAPFITLTHKKFYKG